MFELLGALSAIEKNGDVFGGVSVVVFDEEEGAVQTGEVLAEGPVAVLGSDMHHGVAILVLEVEVDSLISGSVSKAQVTISFHVKQDFFGFE